MNSLLSKISKSFHRSKSGAKKRLSKRFSSSASVRTGSLGTTALNEAEVAILPQVVRDAIISNATHLDKPSVVKTKGVAIFIDISGFTQLGKELSQKFTANTAAEDFGRASLQILNQWTEIVLSWGGDVTKFAGDALLCTWSLSNPAEEEKLPHIVEMAVCAAHEMLLSFYRSVGDSTTEIGMHGGVASGEISHVYLTSESGDKRWYLAVGGAITQATKLLEASRRGEILVLEEGRNWSISIDSEPTGMRFITSVPKEYLSHDMEKKPSTEVEEQFLDEFDNQLLQPKTVRAFLPPLLLDRIQTFRPEGGEMRSVVAMFILLSTAATSPSADIEDCLDTLNNTFLQISDAIRQSNGELRDLLFDDKGCVCIAMWGAYKRIENAELWAIQTAAKRIRKIDPQASIGISSGVCFAGLSGHRTRQDFVVFGHQVNMASRYMGQARPGETIVGLSVQDACSTFYRFEEMQFEIVKAQYTETHKGYVVGNKLAPKRRSTLVLTPNPAQQQQLLIGRSVEVALIEELINTLADQWRSKVENGALDNVERPSNQGMVTVVGRNGIGKTAFTRHLRRTFTVGSFKVAADVFEQYDEEGYFLLRQVVEKLTKLTVELSVDEIREKLEELKEKGIPLRNLPSVLPYLADDDERWRIFFDLEGSGDMHNAPSPTESLAELLVSLFTLNLKSTNQPGIVIVIEDASWADEASCRVFQKFHSIAGNVPGFVLFLCEYRDDEAELILRGPWAALVENTFRKQSLFIKLSLTSLSREECNELATSLFQERFKRASKRGVNLLENPTLVASDLLDLIFSKTDGIPRSLVDIVDWLYQRGLVTLKGPCVCFTSSAKKQQATQYSPESHRDFLIGQFDKLSPEEQSILRIAACMAPDDLEFDSDLVRQVINSRSSLLNVGEPTQFQDALSRLARANFIVQVSTPSLWKFTTADHCQTVLHLVPSRTREEIRSWISEAHASKTLKPLDDFLGIQ